MKKLAFLMMALVLIIAMVLPACKAAPAPEEEILWKGVSAFTSVDPEAKPIYWLEEMVNNNPRLQGKLRIKVLGGPEVIGPFDQLEALQRGTVQVVMSCLAYFAGALPIDNFCELTPYNNGAEEREAGIWDFWNEVNQRLDIYMLFRAQFTPIAMYLQKRVEHISDLRGLKIRTSPTYISIIEGVGAIPVRIPSAELYTALDRGVIDGYCYPIMSLKELGFTEVTKYIIDHPFYTCGSHLFTNLDSWNQLPQDVQQELTEVAKEVEARAADFFPLHTELELEYLKAAGCEFIKLPPDEAEEFLAIAYDRHWALAFDQAPEDAARLRELYGLPPWTGK